MTTIAWRAPMLVADSQLTLGDDRLRTKKLHTLADGSICGAAGDAPAIAKMMRWLSAGCPARRKPRFRPEHAVEVLLVRLDGSVWHYTHDLEPEKLEGRFAAIGTGGRYAVGAMHCGRNALQAVKVAAEYDAYTSGPFDTLVLAPRADPVQP